MENQTTFTVSGFNSKIEIPVEAPKEAVSFSGRAVKLMASKTSTATTQVNYTEGIRIF